MSGSVVSLLTEADRARDSKQWGAAAQHYKRYLELRPKDGGIWVQYGHALKESGNLAAADGAYLAALRRRPWEADTYLQVGHLRKMQQRPAAALFWYRLALGLASRHADARREIETLEAQGIVALPEPLPVPWVSALISVLAFIRRPRAMPLARADLVSPRPTQSDTRPLDPFETAWRQYLPSFMEATSNISALGHEYARLRRDFEKRLSEQDIALRGEIAALRLQIEAMRAPIPPPTTQPLAASPLIVDEMRFERARRNGALRLHIGAGEPGDGYIRVSGDLRSGADIVASADNLPFDPGTIAEIVACHVLQDFDHDQLHQRLLPHWLTMLKPGARLAITVFDAIAMAGSAANGAISIHDYRAMILGRPANGAIAGTNMFSRESLTALLARSGFRNIEIQALSRANGSGLELSVHAYAPEAGHG